MSHYSDQPGLRGKEFSATSLSIINVKWIYIDILVSFDGSPVNVKNVLLCVAKVVKNQ